MLHPARPAILCAAALAACGGEHASRAATAEGGRFAVEWTSSDTALGAARWTGAAEAGWCDSTRRLAVVAARGDTGAALLVAMPDGAPGTFPLLPASDSGAGRHAVAALRWTTTLGVVAVAARSGALELDAARPTVSGRLHGVAPSPGDEDSIVLDARLERIPVRRGPDGCRFLREGVP